MPENVFALVSGLTMTNETYDG